MLSICVGDVTRAVRVDRDIDRFCKCTRARGPHQFRAAVREIEYAVTTAARIHDINGTFVHGQTIRFLDELRFFVLAAEYEVTESLLFGADVQRRREFSQELQPWLIRR